MFVIFVRFLPVLRGKVSIVGIKQCRQQSYTFNWTALPGGAGGSNVDRRHAFARYEIKELRIVLRECCVSLLQDCDISENIYLLCDVQRE